MLEKTVTIGDKEVKFRSSATIPRLYRIKFKRDIFKDLSKLEASYSKKKNEDGSFAMFPPLLLTVTRRLRIGKTTRIKSGQLRIIPRSLEVKAND